MLYELLWECGDVNTETITVQDMLDFNSWKELGDNYPVLKKISVPLDVGLKFVLDSDYLWDFMGRLESLLKNCDFKKNSPEYQVLLDVAHTFSYYILPEDTRDKVKQGELVAKAWEYMYNKMDGCGGTENMDQAMEKVLTNVDLTC